MKALSIKLISFTAVSVVLLFVLDLFYSKKAGNIYISKTSYVITTKSNNYDYVAGGSSRVNNNFNPVVFDSITGLKGFNIGYSGSGLTENYITLYLFLKNGNKIKNYLLQVEDNFLVDPKKSLSYPFHDYFFMSFMGDKNVDEAYTYFVSSAKLFLWKYVPYFKYAEFNNYYKFKYFFNESKPDREFFEYKGYYPIEIKHAKNFPKLRYESTLEEIPVDTINTYYLKKINLLCKENGINFVVYSSPLYAPSYLTYKPKNLHNELTQFCSENGILYFDFMTHAIYKGDSLFYDETHLNSEGTDIFTKQLADSLKSILKK